MERKMEDKLKVGVWLRGGGFVQINKVAVCRA